MTGRDRELVRLMVEEGGRVVLRPGKFPTLMKAGRFVRWLPWGVVERLVGSGAVEKVEVDGDCEGVR